MATTNFSIGETGFAIPDNATVSDFLNADFFGPWWRLLDLRVNLVGLTHTFPADLDFLLVAPDGRTSFEFWSDAGGDVNITNGNFTISDSAASLLPDVTAIASGTYKPTDYSGSFFGAVEDSSNWGFSLSMTINHPAPTGTATLNSVFAGMLVTGGWHLYVRDDTGLDVGSLTSWGISATVNIIVKPDDFNGQGSSDILWRNDSGQVYFWEMYRSEIIGEGGAVHALVPNDWHIQGTGDFDADNTSDILWRHDSGQTYIWEMGTGLNVKAEGTIAHAAVPNDWHIQGTGDFDADGKTDILWRHDSGQTYIWEMNGLNVKAEGTIVHAAVPNDWHIQRIGDFDGDTNSDILWRHDSGQVYIWEMNGLGIKAEGGVAHALVPNDWQIQGIGDFDNDGNSDILWRHDSGQVYIWLMDGLAIKAEGGVAHALVTNDWHVQDIGDFDIDGSSDIVWRNDSGQVYIWLMDGLGIKVEGAVPHAAVSSDWHIFS
jgi:hypothetical protein